MDTRIGFADGEICLRCHHRGGFLGDRCHTHGDHVPHACLSLSASRDPWDFWSLQIVHQREHHNVHGSHHSRAWSGTLHPTPEDRIQIPPLDRNFPEMVCLHSPLIHLSQPVTGFQSNRYCLTVHLIQEGLGKVLSGKDPYYNCSLRMSWIKMKNNETILDSLGTVTGWCWGSCCRRCSCPCGPATQQRRPWWLPLWRQS